MNHRIASTEKHTNKEQYTAPFTAQCVRSSLNRQYKSIGVSQTGQRDVSAISRVMQLQERIY